MTDLALTRYGMFAVVIAMLPALWQKVKQKLSKHGTEEKVSRMDDKELLPCPFCGGEAVMSTYYIECESCEVAPNIDCFHKPREQAIKAWNTRTEGNKGDT